MKRASTASAIPDGEYDNEEFFTPLLGADDDNVKTLGVIRPGIMVLKKGCEQADVDRYDRLVAQGMSWVDMAKELGDKLIPQNVDYFTANRHDCVNPANADLIKKLYADSDGRIRSIPVYFPMNEWWNIIPHRLCCYGLTRGLKHRSGFEYERDDRGRIADYRMVCETPEDLEAGKKLFGGRAWTKKPCDPESCPEYQREECRFSGRIYFMIPGIKGMGSFVIPTKSFYSMKRVKKTLRDMYQLTNGRIAYLLHNGETIFVLRKVKATIPCIDWEKGETKMRQQYLIDLDVVVDPLEVAREYSAEKVLQKGARAMTMLGAGVDNTDGVSATGAGTAEFDSPSDEKDHSEHPVEPEPPRCQETPGRQDAPPQTGSDERQCEKGRTAEVPKNGNGRKEMDRDQKAAITKMAARYRIQAETLDRALEGVKFHDEAAKVISELNRGDISRFLPAPA
jgi:hypothetical protein